MSLGMKILLGVCAGILTGMFFGEMVGWLDIAGDVYVGLLQMTVLPYVTVSLIERIGRLTAGEARTLMGRAGLVKLALWAVTIGTILILPLSLPKWNAGAFFSSSLIEHPGPFDFLELYLPINPFHSLANNIVPAVVLFSIAFGIALIGVKGKHRLIEPLETISDALGAISNFVVRLAPWGTFALTASAAGELSPTELVRIAGYVSTFTAAVVLLGFVVLPGLASALTPISMRRILAGSRNAMLTAFATGKLFAVLPLIQADVRAQLESEGVDADRAEAAADVFVPLGYPFPNAGKLLSILFIPFAAWFIGTPLELSQYPMLLSVGLLAFFGSALAAIPFLLDLFRLPSDLLPLFLVAGIWCSRVGDVLGAIHLNTFTLIGSFWNEGRIEVRPAKMFRWVVLSVVVGAAAMWANHAVIERAIEGQERTIDLAAALGLTDEFVEIEVLEEPVPHPSPQLADETALARIRRTGQLRVGFVPSVPPFSHPNVRGDQVGFDIDLIQRFAWDLEARLVLIPTTRAAIRDAFEADHFDIAVGGIPSTIETFDLFAESRSYLDLHAAILVRDHEAKYYRSADAIREKAARDGLRLGYVVDGIFVRRGHVLPGVERVEVERVRDFVEGRTDAEALLVSAESGAVATMAFPEFSVVVPEGTDIRIPLVFAVKDDPELRRILDAWIQIREDDGTVEILYDYWVLGRAVEQRQGPRWSVIRDVLHWVD